MQQKLNSNSMLLEANPLSEGLQRNRTPEPCCIVIFGATGDLTKRKLMPALYALASDGLLPKGSTIIGAGRTQMSREQFIAQMKEDVKKYGRISLNEKVWNNFQEGLFYTTVKHDTHDGFEELKTLLNKVDAERGAKGNHIFYLSIPPSGFKEVVHRLGEEGLSKQENPDQFRRLIIEKPFGHNLETAKVLNRDLHVAFEEAQIYRIDHYLGKETVQNILVFRFANGIFEPLWNRQYIDHVQITVAESIGIEGRGQYYEESGALRDIMQNHIMQLVAIIGMEAPSNFRAESVRDEKVKLLRAIRPIADDDVLSQTCRGQYGEGWVEGEKVCGYREEPGVDKNSIRETFACVKVDIDNWRWAGTPFYLRTGKRMPKRSSEIAIQFRNAPHSPFSRRTNVSHSVNAPINIDPNVLVLRIQPDEGITLRFSAKVPGQSVQIRNVNMDFLYGSSFLNQSPEAYERLLLDAMLGDPTLFAREDEVEEAWRFCTDILDGWRNHPPDPKAFPNYAAGTWGPEEADEFMARDSRAWRRP